MRTNKTASVATNNKRKKYMGEKRAEARFQSLSHIDVLEIEVL